MPKAVLHLSRLKLYDIMTELMYFPPSITAPLGYIVHLRTNIQVYVKYN